MTFPQNLSVIFAPKCFTTPSLSQVTAKCTPDTRPATSATTSSPPWAPSTGTSGRCTRWSPGPGPRRLLTFLNLFCTSHWILNKVYFQMCRYSFLSFKAFLDRKCKRLLPSRNTWSIPQGDQIHLSKRKVKEYKLKKFKFDEKKQVFDKT